MPRHMKNKTSTTKQSMKDKQLINIAPQQNYNDTEHGHDNKRKLAINNYNEKERETETYKQQQTEQ